MTRAPEPFAAVHVLKDPARDGPPADARNPVPKDGAPKPHGPTADDLRDDGPGAAEDGLRRRRLVVVEIRHRHARQSLVDRALDRAQVAFLFR